MHRACCPICGALIVKDHHPRVGKMINCAECGAELEIICLKPFEVDYPLEYSWNWGQLEDSA